MAEGQLLDLELKCYQKECIIWGVLFNIATEEVLVCLENIYIKFPMQPLLELLLFKHH